MKKFNLSKGLSVGLLTLALCFACFGAVKASADGTGSGSATATSGSGSSSEVSKAKAITSIRYDATKDAVIFEADGPGSVFWVIFKNEDAKELKEKDYKGTATLKLSDGKYIAEVSVAGRDGFKTAVNKDLYVYADVAKTTGSKIPNVKVAKTDIKKLVINIDYVKVAKGVNDVAISSIETTSNDKTVKVYSGSELAALLEKLQYGADGKNPSWLAVNPTEEAVAEGSTSGSESGSGSGSGSGNNTAKAPQAFTLDFVNSKIDAGAKFQFRLIGTSGEAKTGTRGCKAVKVAVKKAAKAIGKLTIDVSVNAAVIKNGFDFAVYKVPATGSGSGTSSGSATSTSGTSTSGVPTSPDKGGINTWYTVLPYNKGEKAATEPIMATADFTPYKKYDGEKASVAAMFTKTKVKSVLVSDLFTYANADISSDNLYIYVRKSAGVGKPAGKWSNSFDITSVAGKPVPDLKEAGKKTIGEKDSKDFYKAAFTAASGDTGTNFEYLVVEAADVEKVDFTTAKWTKYNATKGIKLGAKSKYAATDSTDGKATPHELADGCFIFVRRQGSKKNPVKLASEYVITKINGDNWEVKELTDGKAPAAGSTSGSGSTSGTSSGS